MSTEPVSAEPPTNIAVDAWPLIQAFREAGGVGFERLGVAKARAAYEVSCAQNSLAREPMARVETLSVGENGAVPGRLYVPEHAAEDPGIILFLHGGGWVIGSLDTHDALCRYVAHRSGSAVLAVDYRLAPEHQYPAAIDDARQALRWLRTKPHELGFTPSGIVVMGDSAGAGLAAILAQENTHSPTGSELIAQVLLYPVTDLSMQTRSYQRVASGYPLTAHTMAWFADLYVPYKKDRLRADVSPLQGTFLRPPAPAFVCTVGLDPLADEGIAYAGSLALAGGQVDHVHLPMHAHGLFTAAGRISTGRVLLDRAAAFIADVVANSRESSKPRPQGV